MSAASPRRYSRDVKHVGLRTAPGRADRHTHVAVFNGAGNGCTTAAADGHYHFVRELELLPAADGHTHELGIIRVELTAEEARKTPTSKRAQAAHQAESRRRRRVA